jgi:hypothetical protein
MERDRRKKKGASVDKSQDVCYHCRQKGHWKAECPVLHRERMQRRQDSVDLANKLDEATTNDEQLTDTEMEELLQQTESDPPQDLAQAAAAAAPQVTAEAAAPQMVTGRNNVRGQSWSDSESNSTALAGLVAAVQALQTRQETLAGVFARARMCPYHLRGSSSALFSVSHWHVVAVEQPPSVAIPMRSMGN